MTKRQKKRKKKKPENESYEIEIQDWEADYHFGLNILSRGSDGGAYWEHSKLILTGNILLPALEKANNARLELAGDPQMDDHWSVKPTIISSKAIGFMEIPRGDDTLLFYCSIPSRALPFVTQIVDSGKIKYASIFGTKLKWKKGTIARIGLSKHREE